MSEATIRNGRAGCARRGCARSFGLIRGGLLTSQRWRYKDQVDPPRWMHGRPPHERAGHRVQVGAGWLEVTDGSAPDGEQLIPLPARLECPECHLIQTVGTVSE